MSDENAAVEQVTVETMPMLPQERVSRHVRASAKLFAIGAPVLVIAIVGMFRIGYHSWKGPLLGIGFGLCTAVLYAATLLAILGLVSVWRTPHPIRNGVLSLLLLISGGFMGLVSLMLAGSIWQNRWH